tara:strand:- start:160 stop:924 length:765 start_codon:yes stop_codon:yes gene_type:complete
MHIPKTGTSFRDVLLKALCEEDAPIVMPARIAPLPTKCKNLFVSHENPRKNWPIGHHIPLNPSQTTDVTNVVTFIRSPRHRLLSQFFGVQGDQYKLLNSSFSQLSVREKNDAILAFANKYHYQGCQTKMVLGVRCQDPVGPEKLRILDACKRVNNFAFVGITDQWEASVCLFHHLFGGNFGQEEGKNMRKTLFPYTSNLLVEYEDEHDFALFSCAWKRFYNQVRGTRCEQFLEKDIFSELSVQQLFSTSVDHSA